MKSRSVRQSNPGSEIKTRCLTLTFTVPSEGLGLSDLDPTEQVEGRETTLLKSPVYEVHHVEGLLFRRCYSQGLIDRPGFLRGSTTPRIPSSHVDIVVEDFILVTEP